MIHLPLTRLGRHQKVTAVNRARDLARCSWGHPVVSAEVHDGRGSRVAEDTPERVPLLGRLGVARICVSHAFSSGTGIMVIVAPEFRVGYGSHVRFTWTFGNQSISNDMSIGFTCCLCFECDMKFIYGVWSTHRPVCIPRAPQSTAGSDLVLSIVRTPLQCGVASVSVKSRKHRTKCVGARCLPKLSSPRLNRPQSTKRRSDMIPVKML